MDFPFRTVDESSHFPSWHFVADHRLTAVGSGRGSPFHSLSIMEPEELYDELATRFPPLWPQSPAWSWVNVHDGQGPKVQAISVLLAETFASEEVIVLVHSTPGVAVQMQAAAVASYVAPFVLRYEIQVADLELKRFFSIADSGVATNDA